MLVRLRKGVGRVNIYLILCGGEKRRKEMKKIGYLLGIISAIVLIRNVDCFAFPMISRTSEVTSVVTINPDGTFKYNYTVINTSPAPQWIESEGGVEVEVEVWPTEVWPTIVDYEVPLDSPGDIWGILSPEYWSYEILSYSDYITRFGEPNPFGAPYILHWYTGYTDTEFPSPMVPVGYKPIVPVGYNARFESDYYEPSTDGFIFTSTFSPVDGPYLTSWQDEFRFIGDPPLPGGGPIGGGGTPPFSPVPEPSTMLLLGLGFGLFGVGRVKKVIGK